MNTSSGNENEASAKVEGRPTWLKVIMSIIKKKHKNKKRQGWGAFIGYLRNNPEDAKVAEDNSGYFPFHYACRYNAPIEVIREMLDIDPEAAAAKDKDGFTPIFDLLDVNCGSPSIEAVNLLIDANPNALGDWVVFPDGSRSLPLMDAFSFDQNTSEVFQLVLKCTPKRNHVEFVRWACKKAKINHKEKMEVILDCVNPIVLRIAEALHMACNNPNLPDDFIFQFCNKYPAAAHKRDSKGKYPKLIPRFKRKLENQDGRLKTYSQKVEAITVGMALSEAARNREEGEHNTTKSALANEKKRNRQVEQELCQLKKLRTMQGVEMVAAGAVRESNHRRSMSLSEAARKREEGEHNVTKSALAEEKKRNRHLEQALAEEKKRNRELEQDFRELKKLKTIQGMALLNCKREKKEVKKEKREVEACNKKLKKENDDLKQKLDKIQAMTKCLLIVTLAGLYCVKEVFDFYA